MSSQKMLKNKVAPIKMDAMSWAKLVELRLLFSEDDPLFSKLESRFVAHLKYPFTRCEFSLLCKPKGKSAKPISTTLFDVETNEWQLSVWDDHDYAVKKIGFPAESPDVLLAALSDLWRIEDLRSFRLEVEGTAQMELL